MKNTPTNRRNFISNSAKTIITMSAGLAAIESLSSFGYKIPTPGSAAFITGFKQEPLPYAYHSLEKAIDALTMEIHYTKHAAAYSTNLLDAAKAENIDTTKPLEEVLSKVSAYSAKVRNNGGGHYNHELFWKTLSPDGGGAPTGKLLAAVEQTFTSFDAFKTKFADAGKNRFGSGWAWLYLDRDHKLQIGSTANQDNPLMDISDIKGFPLLGLDVWEHAYYLRYQNKRADYINAWWNVVNWKFIQNRYESQS